MLERELDAAVQGFSRDLAALGRELRHLAWEGWPVLAPLAAICLLYVWLALDTPMGWMYAGILMGSVLLIVLLSVLSTVPTRSRRRRRIERWPGPLASLSEPVPFGVDEQAGRRWRRQGWLWRRMGVPVALRLDRHLLIGGETGGGKSVALSAIVASAACDPSIRLVLLDAKRLELAIWKHAADAFVGPSLEDAGAVLKEVRDEVDRRTTIMEAECAKTGIPVRNAMPDMSRIVVIIDELAEYTNCGKESAEIVSTLRSLVSLGRAVGVVIVAATQKPQASVVPSEVRDLFPYRFALRCGTPQMSDTILGSGWASREADASRLPSQPGLGLLLVDGYQPQRIQTYPLSDAELASLSQQARERRSST